MGIFIHGNTSNIQKIIMMYSHINQISSTLINDGLVKIDYYPDDYYAEIAIHTDLFGSNNDGFSYEKVIEKLKSDLYLCEFKKFDDSNNAIFMTKLKYFSHKNSKISISDQYSELKAKFSGNGLFRITVWEENGYFELRFSKDQMINTDYNSILDELKNMSYDARFGGLITENFVVVNNGVVSTKPGTVILINVSFKV